ncbi:hypothetical protein GCM10010329_77170 [Streptomyces spiroverticillatus]|uniref:Uncharacterized protein n=1 Tax=Streptomyces finlayi TaxID=67296 RepID=A0A918X5G9_9ACTN|nr:hypothetical protein [Streptomyces finlayi]GHA42843.1 hypothetical protein GCM10010329_77170 [Streptomyces spiroverticillatus]GHD13869.1 hypothetical protein GCM10010334_72580 [Streptomyces finlayi]
MTPATAPDGGCETILPGWSGSSTLMFGNQAPAWDDRMRSVLVFQATAVPMSTTSGGGSTMRKASLAAHTRAASSYTAFTPVWCAVLGSVNFGRTRSGRHSSWKNGSARPRAVMASLKAVESGCPEAFPAPASTVPMTWPNVHVYVD